MFIVSKQSFWLFWSTKGVGLKKISDQVENKNISDITTVNKKVNDCAGCLFPQRKSKTKYLLFLLIIFKHIMI